MSNGYIHFTLEVRSTINAFVMDGEHQDTCCSFPLLTWSPSILALLSSVYTAHPVGFFLEPTLKAFKEFILRLKPHRSFKELRLP